MLLSSDIRRGRNCVFQLHVHLVFVTKYRDRIFDGDAINRLRVIFAKVCTDFAAELVEMDGEGDHAHLLVNYPPKHSISTLVNSLKGVSRENASPRTTRPEASLLEGRSLVAVVFCRQLRWCSDWHPQGVHRAAKDAALTVNAGLYSRPEGRGFTPPRIETNKFIVIKTGREIAGS
jgi:REP-associated tyrosine transposase